MKPPPFDYERPHDLAAALGLLERYGADARPLAGGQSLLPMLALRIARPAVLVDIGRLAELRGVQQEDGHVVVGAATTQRELERDPVIVQHLPLLAAATRLIGHPSIRTRGTIGGSIAHADPSAEYPAVALALDAELVLRGPQGERVVPAADFFLGPFTTALADSELLTAIRFPLPSASTVWAIEEVARRHGDFALAGAVAIVEPGEDGRCRRAALALFGVASRPFRATDAEGALQGQPLTSQTFREVAQLAVSAIDEPLSDVHGSAEYRRRIAAVVVRRALEAAAARAGAV